MGRENINNKYQKVLADFEKSYNWKSDSSLFINHTKDSQIKFSKRNTNLPSQEEISSVNARLPILVSDGTLFTKVEFDEKTKVQTFYYKFTREVDQSLITKDNINQMKVNIIKLLKGTKSEKRLLAGVIFLYVYQSINNNKLYEIKITANDLK